MNLQQITEFPEDLKSMPSGQLQMLGHQLLGHLLVAIDKGGQNPFVLAVVNLDYFWICFHHPVAINSKSCMMDKVRQNRAAAMVVDGLMKKIVPLEPQSGIGEVLLHFFMETP